MKKYKLINTKTKEEHLCNKITIDGFDYYVSGEIIKDVRQYKGKWQIEKGYILNKFPTYLTDLSDCRLITATNNPNIDIPKVVDEVDQYTMAKEYAIKTKSPNRESHRQGFVKGYNKSQETHPNSDEDTIEFGQWVSHNDWVYLPSKKYWVNEEQEELEQKLSSKELFQLWKEQQTKIVYYE